MQLVILFAALIAAVSAAVLPRAAGPLYYIESVAARGQNPDVTGLFMEQYHSGAGLNNINMNTVGDATEFRYNLTSKALFRIEKYYYAVGLPNIVPQDKRLRGSYRLVTFNVGGEAQSQFRINSTSNYLTLLNKPAKFLRFSVCHTRFIADDEPESSYMQLLWRVGAPVEGCADVHLRGQKYP